MTAEIYPQFPRVNIDCKGSGYFNVSTSVTSDQVDDLIKMVCRLEAAKNEPIDC